MIVIANYGPTWFEKLSMPIKKKVNLNAFNQFGAGNKKFEEGAGH